MAQPKKRGCFMVYRRCNRGLALRTPDSSLGRVGYYQCGPETALAGEGSGASAARASFSIRMNSLM